MQRTVSRSDLRSPESSPQPEPDSETLARLKDVPRFDFINTAHDTIGTDEAIADDDELDFQLFASSKPEAAPAASRIRLRSPTPQTAEPGFLGDGRPSSYYFAAEDGEASYDETALSGADIVALSQTSWPGSAYPWKVMHLPASGETRKARGVAGNLFGKLVVSEAPKRKRQGKKARIKIRTRLSASRTKVEQQKLDAEAKETALREKKTRLNREKKIKKRMKEKAEKAQKADGVEAGE